MRNIKDIKIDHKTLYEILENHQHWLKRDCDGWEEMKANLSNADLRYADLGYANLNNANLNNANLRYANLRYANLNNADLNNADLNGVNLSNAILNDTEQIRKGIKLSQSMIGWKKCKNNVIVKLEIPRGAIVFSINNKKCRTDKAIVREIIGADRAYSIYGYLSYYVGDKIKVYDFNCEYNVECCSGIHFFRTKKEAEEYEF